MSLDLIKESEVRALLGDVSAKTIARYRGKYWTEGAHYVKPVQRCLYVKPMIEDWIIHRDDPARHQNAVEAWYKQAQYPTKPKRGK
jgi:hypothetical protein